MATTSLFVTEAFGPTFTNGGITFSGGTTGAECSLTAGDAKTIEYGAGPFTLQFPMASAIDLSAVTINSVQVKWTMTTDSVDWTTGADSWVGTEDSGGNIDIDDIYPLTESGGIWSSAVMVVNPSSGNPWQKSELVWDGVTLEGVWWHSFGFASGTFASIDKIEVVVDYTATANDWWKLSTATEPFLKPGTTINGQEIDWPIFDGTIDGHPVQYNAPDQFITICGVQYPLASIIKTGS